MAVINVKRKWSDEQAPTNLQGSTARRVFTVLLDDGDDAELRAIIARQATGVPRKRSIYHGSYPYLRCTSVYPKAVTPFMYEVTCEYATGPKADEAVDQPAKVSWGSLTIRQPTDYDVNGLPLVNAVGEPFDPPIEEDFVFPVLRITRAEAYYDGMKISQYANSVNAESFRGARPGTCWLKPPVADEVIEDESSHWMVSYEIVHNPYPRPEGGGDLGWSRRLANRGRGVWTWLEDKGIWAYDPLVSKKTGELISEPRDLNLAGTAMLDKDADTLWVYFDTKHTVSWRPLHLE